MIKFIREIVENFKKNALVDDIVREFDAIVFIIENCFTMEDFIYCKKKIRQFQNRWDKEDENSYGSKMSEKLNLLYNKRLVKQKYYISLYAQKKKNKKV